MERLSKSAIVQKITDSINRGEDLDFRCIRKDSGIVMSIKIELSEQEVFVDLQGVRWIME